MPDANFTGPRVLRIAGIVDFVVAVFVLWAPTVRVNFGNTVTYGFAAFLLLGSATMFLLANRMERQLASTR